MIIEVVQNGAVIATKDVSDGNYKIGRGPDSDFQLRSAQVSKQHALLVIKGGRVALVDLGSQNGVFVNGILIKKQLVTSKDDIVIAEFRLRIVGNAGAKAPRNNTVRQPMNQGNAAININFQEQAAANEEAIPPQEKFLKLIDEKILLPFYEVNRTVDWRLVLATILMSALIATVVLSVIPIVRWAKDLTAKEAIGRAQTVLSQTVRENYRVLSKANDVTRLTVEACETETGILACYIVDPRTLGVLSPAKLFNKTVTTVEAGEEDAYTLLAIKRIKEKEEKVAIQKNENTWIIAQPIYVYSQDTNDKELTAIGIAVFQVSNQLTSTFKPLSEAVLFAVMLSLAAYFFIFKLFTYPVNQMREQLDAALKGEEIVVNSVFQIPELEALAQEVNFAVSRVKQGGGGGQVTNTGGSDEDEALIKTFMAVDEITSDGILLLDRENKVRYVGNILAELISMRNQYAVGKNISEAAQDQAFAGTVLDLVSQVIGSLGQTQSAQLDINGTSRPMMASAQRNAAGEIRFILVCVRMGVA